MTVPVLVVQRLSAASGIPADDAVIDFACNLDTLTSADADAVAANIESWWETVQVIPGPDLAPAGLVGNLWAPTGSPNLEVAFYDLTGHLDGSAHGSPDFVRSLDIDHSTTDCYPAELAAKVSIHADLSGVPEISGATRPRARRRGGFFVPWIVLPYTHEDADTASSTQDAGNNYRPSQSLKDCFNAATQFLNGELPNGLGVWSRADAVIRDVVGGWVDDAFDTQRRRGPALTGRTAWGS